jgi:hypothetical protein
LDTDIDDGGRYRQAGRIGEQDLVRAALDQQRSDPA